MIRQAEKDVPALAWIENEILADAVSSGNLSPAVKRIEEKYGLPNGTLGVGRSKQTMLLSLPYLLLVFPRETWRSNALTYAQLETEWPVSILPPERFHLR